MAIQLARIYDDTPGHRVLVDRLWPRGVSKQSALWHTWRKDLAPSNALRQGLHDGSLLFEQFAVAYREELDAREEPHGLDPADLVLVTAVKRPERSHCTVLRDWLADQ